jgi:hypothetical protein
LRRKIRKTMMTPSTMMMTPLMMRTPTLILVGMKRKKKKNPKAALQECTDPNPPTKA